ncbi:MAG: pyridoxamine 5'-phosphate oxidase family protein [Actinobacteria bacterium]|nr:pyridoxamine 5'-phosphate oxidase family protein [Actinomycetota bacterium]
MKLPENVQNVMRNGHNVWVATTGEDGTPNIAIKGSGSLLDDENLFFADLFSKKTRANLLKNDSVAVAIYEPDDDVAVQVKGKASFVDSGPLFDKVSDTIAGLQAGLPPVKSVVKITVESVWDLSAGPNSGERIV